MSIAGYLRPKAGMILKCDFRGSVHPEMGKHRPVIVVGEERPGRVGTVLVVPLSTRRPTTICDFHVQLPESSVPPCLDRRKEQWVKCDMLTTVSLHRLDRYWLYRDALGKRKYGTPRVGSGTLAAVGVAIRSVLDVSL